MTSILQNTVVRLSLKAIGVVLFLWLLSQIDRSSLLESLKGVDMGLFFVSFLLLLLSYVCKAVRWHALVVHAGGPQSAHFSWATYNIGTFLGVVTPAKLGELSRVGYLKSRNVPASTALSMVVVDRVFDVFVVGALALWAVLVLFGMQWFWVVTGSSLTGGAALFFLWKYVRRFQSSQHWLESLLSLVRRPALFLQLVLVTVLSWCVYCLWAYLLAESMQLGVPLLSLCAAIIFAGIIALLPIAPSGLGTRDATLVWLLLPFGVAAPEAIALSLLMFVSILLSTLLGAWYWVRGI